MIYVFLAEGFEEMEALTPVDVLRRAGKEVKTVSVSGEKTVTGSHNIPVVADITLKEVKSEKAKAYILPGGIPGTPNLLKSEELKKLLLSADKDTLLCAICAAPQVLLSLGLLNERKYTCYPGCEDKSKGVYTKSRVEISKADNKNTVITGIGAGGAAEFAFAVLSELDKDDTAAKNIEKAMQFGK